MSRLLIPKDQPFSLDLTLGCGQVFRWTLRDGWWHGIIGNYSIRIRQQGRHLVFYGADPGVVTEYFQLGLDLPAILESIDRDPLIHECIRHCAGLRIIRQPAWECLASYICATYTNIPAIKQKIASLSNQYGELIPGSNSGPAFTFPSAEALAGAPLLNLQQCRLGYRAPYLLRTACMIASDPGWEERILSLPYPEAHKELRKLPGAGEKVADCVLLFGFGKYEAFPVDVWIQRIMQTWYHAGDLRSAARIGRLGRSLFGEYAGYAQEYLFCDRHNLSKVPLPG